MGRLLRIALLAAIVLASGTASAAPAPFDRARDKIAEALRLESLAFERLQVDQKDPEIDRLLRRSMEILEEAKALPNLPPSVTQQVTKAHAADKGMVEKILPKVEQFRRWVPNFTLGIAIFAKDEALDDLSDAAWKANQQKQATPVRVAAPACRQLAALSQRSAVALPGCTLSPTWDIYVAANAKQAKCSFRGPAGPISASRPLFPGTAQEKSCRFAGFRTVAGSRKRVVRATLNITVPPDAKSAAPRVVRVSAHWR